MYGLTLTTGHTPMERMRIRNALTDAHDALPIYVRIRNGRSGLICGTVDPETTMPEFLNALDAAGINTVIQAKQEQLDAWIAAQK